MIGALAIVTALQSLGVPVAPLLTTLGVGSLAVALALQDTLANFFAGLYLLADRPIGAGDYIKIHDGEEGYVETIGWRSSRLRTGTGNMVIVPNQKLSQAILINYHRPSTAVMMTMTITVATGPTTQRGGGLPHRGAGAGGGRGGGAQRGEADRPAGQRQRRRAGLELHRSGPVLRGAGPGRTRAPQAAPRPTRPGTNRSGGSGANLSAARPADRRPQSRGKPIGELIVQILWKPAK